MDSLSSSHSYTGSVALSLLIWIVCATLTVMSAFVYVELATSIPEEGGDYAYALYVGWRAVAFSFMIVSVLLMAPASLAVQAIIFGEYLVQGVSPYIELERFWGKFAEKAFGLSLLALVTTLNLFSLENFAARFQTFAMVMKLFAKGTIISAGVYLLIFKNGTTNIASPFANSHWDPNSLAMATLAGLYAFGGYDILNYGTPEIHKPRRNIPLAVVIGLSIVTVIYLSINISFFTVLPIDEVSNSTAVAAKFAERTLGDYSFVLPLMISLSLLSTINSNIFRGSRTIHAAAKKKQLPSFLSGTHLLTGSPRAAVLAHSVLAAFFFFVDVKHLIDCRVFVSLAQRAVTSAILLLIRWRGIPVQPNPFRVPVLLIVLLRALSAFLVLLTLIKMSFITLVGIVILTVSIFSYHLLSRVKWSCDAFAHLDGRSAAIVNKLFGLEFSSTESKTRKNKQSPEDLPSTAPLS